MGKVRNGALKLALLGTAAAMGSMVLVDAAFAQSAPEATSAGGQSSDEAIVVIGTRRTDRTLTNSASPVDVISAADLGGQPTANMLDTVRAVIPSFYVGQNTISDASTFTRAPSLRGLPGDEVLVMLDGKRYNRAALVQVYTGGDNGLSFGSQGSDISAIPSIAIDNLQVLRDGATAQYGSDAIAGVLNFGLKDDPSGFDVEARYGAYYQDSEETSQQIAVNFGLPLFGNGFVNVSAEYNDEEGTSRGATRPIALQFAALYPNLASQLPNYPEPAQIWGTSPSHGYKLLVNSGFDVTADSQLYFFVNAAKNEGNQSFNYRSPISGTAVDVEGVTRNLGANAAFTNTFFLTPCPAATATCPAGGFVRDTNTFLFSSLYPAGFTPRFVGEATETFGALGYKGELDSGLTYDLSTVASENSLELSMYSSLSPTFGPQSQTSFEFGELIQKERGVNLDLTYPLQMGLASDVTLSGGLEWRKETYAQTAGDAQSYGAGPYALPQQLYTLVSPGVYTPSGQTSALGPGASGYGGTSPEAAGEWSQESYGGYVGAEADLTSALSVGVAARYEEYSTFGETTVGKVNAIYHFTDNFAIRGTVGTGFHAPSPGQSNDQILTTNFVAGNQVQTGTYPVESPISQYYGATTLKPAEATNYGVGFVLEPWAATTITVDAYQIDVENRLGISQNFNVTAADIIAEPALAAVGEGGNVNYFTNAFDTTTKGVDVVATHLTNWGGADLAFTLAYNYNKSDVTAFDPDIIGPDQIINVARLAPNHRANFSVNWALDDLSINWRLYYYGSWRNETDYPGQEFGEKVTMDLDVSYDIADHYAITVGAQNLFDEYPDKIAHSPGVNNVYASTGSLADGQIYPRNGGPFGINGGFMYVKLKASY
jgi:iron complex outermembrane recepter protein